MFWKTAREDGDTSEYPTDLLNLDYNFLTNSILVTKKDTFDSPLAAYLNGEEVNIYFVCNCVKNPGEFVLPVSGNAGNPDNEDWDGVDRDNMHVVSFKLEIDGLNDCSKSYFQ